MRKVPKHLVGHYASRLAERLCVFTGFMMLFGGFPGPLLIAILVLVFDISWWYLYDRGHFDGTPS